MVMFVWATVMAWASATAAEGVFLRWRAMVLGIRRV